MFLVSSHRLLCSVLLLISCGESVSKAVQNINKFILIRNSSIFIDKTSLLKRIFSYDFLLITAPRKFGKSTNLQMIKLFLGNNNPKDRVASVFRNTKIWRDEEFIVRHFCMYPVIYCTFRPKGLVESFRDVARELKISVRDAFVNHKYLLESPQIGKVMKEHFLKYCYLEVDDFEIGLKFLSEVLYIHHSKKVTVLIDDYDYSLSYSIFKKEIDSTKTAQLLFRIIDNTININEFVEKGVVMGYLPFKLGVQFSGLYLLEHFKFMETKDFTPYFGFTQRETESLLDKFGFMKYLNNVTEWYGGYSYIRSDFHIYNPWSVLMFLKTKTIDIHWVTKASKRMLYDFIEPHYDLKEDLTKLVENKNLTLQAVESFTTYEVERMKNVQFASYSYREDSVENNIFLQLLLESGYLTFAVKYKVTPISTQVKFPNMEIRKVFEQVLIRLAAVYPDIDRY